MPTEPMKRPNNWEQIGLLWTEPPHCPPCEFRYENERQRVAAARTILSLYGERKCYRDPTQPDGWYRPNDLGRLAVISWECAMWASKYDRHRTADERAKCKANLDAFIYYFGSWEEGAGIVDAPLQFIFAMEMPSLEQAALGCALGSKAVQT